MRASFSPRTAWIALKTGVGKMTTTWLGTSEARAAELVIVKPPIYGG